MTHGRLYLTWQGQNIWSGNSTRSGNKITLSRRHLLDSSSSDWQGKKHCPREEYQPPWGDWEVRTDMPFPSTCNIKLLEGPNYLWPSVVMVKSKILLYYQKNKKNVMLNLWCTEKRGKVKDFFSLKVREKNVTLELWCTVRPVKLSKWTHIMRRLGRGWCKVKIILCPIKKGERGSPPKERKRLFLFFSKNKKRSVRAWRELSRLSVMYT